MSNVDLQKLVDKAGKMALNNIWGESAYKINMMILKLDHNNCSAYTRLAKYYKLNDNIVEVKNMYSKVLDIDPNNYGAINNLDDIERDQKESDTVDKIKTTSECLKDGQSSMVKGRYKLAAKLFSRAYNIDPLLVYAVNQASAYKKMGKYDSIEKLYTQLIDGSHKKSDVEAINKEFKLLRLNIASVVE